MTDIPRVAAIRAGIATLAVLALTVVHHVYGAIRYDTPWRMHVTHVAAIMALLLAGALLLHLRQPAATIGRVARVFFAALALLGPILWIGLFEGGYNHALKLVIAGMPLSQSTFQSLYPPGLYQPAGDWIFEATGVLQLVVAIVALRALLQFWRGSSRVPQGVHNA